MTACGRRDSMQQGNDRVGTVEDLGMPRDSKKGTLDIPRDSKKGTLLVAPFPEKALKETEEKELSPELLELGLENPWVQ